MKFLRYINGPPATCIDFGLHFTNDTPRLLLDRDVPCDVAVACVARFPGAYVIDDDGADAVVIPAPVAVRDADADEPTRDDKE